MVGVGVKGLPHGEVTSDLTCPQGGLEGMCTMPAAYPQGFREDVVRVARSREDGITIAQIAKDFGVHEMTLHKRIRQADIDDGNRAAAYLSQANLPGKGSTRS